METFFVARGYPNDLIRRGREQASIRSGLKFWRVTLAVTPQMIEYH